MRLIRFISMFLFAAVASLPIASYGQNTLKEPDFAYPQTVLSDATTALTKYNRTPGTGSLRLRAILEIMAAERSIDPQKAFTFPAFIEEQLKVKGLTDADKAMMKALEAGVLFDIYKNNRYTYDRVAAPLKPYPSDVSLWSGEQFSSRIDSLYAEARRLAAGTKSSLKDYKSCLEYNDYGLLYIPDVAAFADYKTYDFLDRERASSFAAEVAKKYATGTPEFFYWKVLAAAGKRETLEQLYRDNASDEAARYVLERLVNGGVSLQSDIEDGRHRTRRDEEIAMLRQSLADFPGWYGNNSLRNALGSRTQPNLSVSSMLLVDISSTLKITATAEFCKTVTVRLYKVDTEDNISIKSLLARKCMAERTITGLPTDTTFKVEFKMEKEGLYRWTASVDGQRPSASQLVKVSPYLPMVISGLDGEGYVVATDMTSGAPFAGVEATLNSEVRFNKKGKSSAIGKTDKNGLLRFKTFPDSISHYQSVDVRYGSMKFDNLNVQIPWKRTPQVNNITILTDRNLYHQGDTIRWVVVASDKNNVAAGMQATVAFYDVNIEKIDETVCTLDEYGRAGGFFVTKKDVLTGNWRINAKVGDNRADTYVMVSDFKLPTFRAEVTSVERDVPTPGAVRLSGTAITYSGMPVADAKVSMELSRTFRTYRFAPLGKLGELSGITDAAGRFTFDIPDSMLTKDTDIIAQLTITAPDGTTAETSRGFTIGKPYVLTIEAPANADCDAPVEVTFRAIDANSHYATVAVKWQLGTDGKTLAEGTATTGKTAKLDLSNLAAGLYTLSVAPVDSALADADKYVKITLFNEKRGEVPAHFGRLFVPFNKMKVTKGTGELLVGVKDTLAYVYTAVAEDGKITTMRQERLAPGFHRLKIKAAGEDSQVRIFTVADGICYNYTIKIELAKEPQTKLIAESFRDKIAPGQTETWRFRLVDGKDKPLHAAMVATLYNKALDELYNGSWRERLRGYSDKTIYNMSLVSGRNFNVGFVERVPYKNLKTTDILYPGFRYLNIGGYIYMGNNYGRPLMSKATASGQVTELLIVEDSGSEESEDVYVADSANDSRIPNTQEYNYRVAEVLQAFWRPSLTADKDGNIDLSFTMPNANGSWVFKSLAWDKNLESASYIAECISNKPVMVHPALPRYLRAGDKARLLATVYNSRDESFVAVTTVEIFDPADGKVVASTESTDTIAANGSVIVGIDVEAPSSSAALGYRVRSTAANFTDGEQSLLPILASSATVVESTEFYLNPGDTKPVELTIKASKDATATLQYCQNPVWTAVKAMRGIAAKGITSAEGYASRLFSALAAAKIIGDNPEVEKVIKQWSENPGEGAFMSMLEKNADLKMLMLDRTPWVQAAANDDSRMAMLADALDSTKVAASIESTIADLAKLQNADGGFAWTDWYKASSVWSTRNILITLGIANTLGMLPSDTCLDEMMQKAYTYLVGEAVKPGMPKTDSELAYIAAALPQLSDSRGKALLAATESAILAGWKNGDVLSKAWDILIVNKKYRRTASEMLESIRQFGVAKPGTGMSFPSISDIRSYATIIQAYAAMCAPKVEIDAMRQWVLVQGQASDDFGAFNPDYVIAALMLTGSVWTDVPVSQSVTVNGKPLEISSMESATGYFAHTLDASGKFTVSITPNGTTPSYGSVVTVGRRPMSKIKARPGRDIAIDKRVLVERDGAWVETTTFGLGERVRVQLTIKTERDLDYVSIVDERPAAFEPVEQLPGYVFDGGTFFYRQNLDASTVLAIACLPKGSYHITYDITAAVAGSFISGIATLQSQYAPELTAHSGAATIEVK